MEKRRLEFAGVREVEEIRVRGGQDSGVNRNLLGCPQWQNTPRLQNPKEGRLDRARSLADFVQEQSATLGTSEEAGAGDGAGVGARKRTEEFAGREILWESSQVYRLEGTAGTASFEMKARATSSLPVPVEPRMSTGSSTPA